jgi:transcriptional regulator GlxA family with amidase domain
MNDLVQEKQKLDYIIYLCPDYPMLPVSGIVEVLNAANSILGFKKYNWQFASHNSDNVNAANGILTNVSYSLQDLRGIAKTISRPEAIMICSGVDVEKYQTPQLMAGLREFSRAGIKIGGISTGAYLLAAANLLDNRKCVVHWEILPQFRLDFEQVSVNSELYTTDERFFTCAGGLAAIDMMLAITSKHYSADVQEQICRLLITNEVRFSDQRQRLLKVDEYDPNGRLAIAVKIMERNISKPVSMTKIAEIVGVSRRQLERWFENDINVSPAKYYVGLRLEVADHLIKSTSLSISEVLERAGFSDNSYFSSTYKTRFGMTPLERRKFFKVFKTR